MIGPNGAGKTTTIRMCLGLTAPDAGTIRAFGHQMPADALLIKQQLGVVSQMDTLDPDFTCAENLLVYGRYFGLNAQTLRPRIPQLLDFAALAHKAQARPGELSGGMKRRLSFIMPGQGARKKSVRQKLNVVASEFKGRNVLLVDDSIVRGTTSREIVQMARDAGARKVYLASAAPPVRFPNVYGIDMPTPQELIAHGRTLDEVRESIGCDALIYQDVDAMKR